MINEDLYMEYVKKNESTDSALTLVQNPETITNYEANTGQMIGIIPNQPYYNINLSLYQDKQGKVFRYCNIEYPKNGAATLIVFKSNDGADKYLLERHFRVFTNRYHYEIPRGFADLTADIDTSFTAIRELKEETNIDLELKVVQLLNLGTIFTDTGLSNAEVNLYAVELKLNETNISTIKNNDIDEEIESFILISESELKQMIMKNQITDTFTLASILKYWNMREI